MSSEVAELDQTAGELPKGWTRRKLGDVCRLWNGRAYKKEELLDQGKYVVLRVGNFFTNDRWYYSDLELEAEKYCDDGDLLYAWSASFGPRVWAGGKVIYHYHIWKITLEDELIDKGFLYHFLDWDAARIKSSMGSGSTMIHVTKGAMEQRAISLPPLDEQRRIAEVLRSADEAIAANRAALDQHARMIDAVFEEWSKQPFPKVALGDLLDFKNGINFEKDERADEGTLTLDVMNMFSVNMTPNYESAYRISKVVPAELTLRNGDILFVRSSVKRDGVGWASLADGFNEATTFCGFIIRGRPMRSDVLSSYVVGVLRAPEYRRWLIQHSTRSALTNINQKTISSVEIPLPSLQQQRDMVEQYEAVASAASDCRTALAKLEQIRVEMTGDLLSGRVRVPA